MPSEPIKVAAGSAAASQLPTILALIAVGAVVYLVVRSLPKLGDLAGDAVKGVGGLAVKGADELAEGTGDFFKGLFTGDEPTFTPITRLRTTQAPDVVYTLTEPGARDPDAPLFNPFTGPDRPRTLTVVRDEFGLSVLQDGGSISTPAPDFFDIEQPSVAQEFGAQVGSLATGLYTNPFFGSLGGPSIQDAGEFLTEGSIVEEVFIDLPKSIFGRIF